MYDTRCSLRYRCLVMVSAWNACDYSKIKITCIPMIKINEKLWRIGSVLILNLVFFVVTFFIFLQPTHLLFRLDWKNIFYSFQIWGNHRLQNANEINSIHRSWLGVWNFLRFLSISGEHFRRFRKYESSVVYRNIWNSDWLVKQFVNR